MEFCLKLSILVVLIGHILVVCNAATLDLLNIAGTFGEPSKKIKQDSNDDSDDSTANFICPGLGKYALRSSTKKNCSMYYECTEKDRKPLLLDTCPKGEKFHRLSRTCVDGKYVNCKWCIKEGNYEDKTSKSHFLRCVPGTIAFRYKCRKGAFDPAKNKCKRTVHNSTMDITLDAIPEPPKDIIEFQKTWDDIANDEKEDSWNKSIERLDSDEAIDGKKKEGKEEKDKKKDDKETKKDDNEEKDKKNDEKEKTDKKKDEKE